MSSSLCECGCGEEAPLAPRNKISRGWIKGQPVRFKAGHNLRMRTGENHPSWNGGKRRKAGGRYVGVRAPDHPRADPSGYVLEHILVAERALGKALPEACQVHHLNGDGTLNSGRNLVICQDQAYHHLLHRRQRALDASGHADWIRCNICRGYGPAEDMYLRDGGKWGSHRTCQTEKNRQRPSRAGGARCAA